MKSKNMRRGFDKIPRGHVGGAHGKSGDVLAPSRNQAKHPRTLEVPFHVQGRKRELEGMSWSGWWKKKELGKDKARRSGSHTWPAWADHSHRMADRPRGHFIFYFFSFPFYLQFGTFHSGPSAWNWRTVRLIIFCQLVICLPSNQNFQL